MNLRFVLIGSGNIARTYVKAVERVAGISLAVMISRAGNRPDFLPPSVPIRRSWEEAGPLCDAVIVATPNGTHGAWIEKAAASGKHVLTEKVLDVSVDAAERAVAACRANKVKLGVSYQHRLRTDNLIVYQMLQEHAFGKCCGAELRVPCWRDEAYYASGSYRGTLALDGGGPFIQQAAHQIDLYRWFFGMPDSVQSQMGRFLHGIEAEDYGAALLRHADGMIGSIMATTCAKPGFPAELTIYTERGTLRMVNDTITEWAIDGIARPGGDRSQELHCGAASAAVEITLDHERLLEDFLDAVRLDREPVISGEDGLQTTKLIAELYQNASWR